MDFDHDNEQPVEVEEDRLSSLPDELIHKILSCLDMKFAVQTCLLSLRWKLLWTSMSCLNFSTNHFYKVRNFAKFVTYVLSHRNHKIDVSSVKLHFNGAANQIFVRKIANYMFSHNVQELIVISWPIHRHTNYPPCLFSSQTLKHFTLSSCYMCACITPKTPWDFPALTTLHLSSIGLCGDLFSKCVNLKNLTLQFFCFEYGVEVFDIISPRLSNILLIDGGYVKVINLIAPQLEKLTVIRCAIKYLNAPRELSSLCYRGCSLPLQLCKERFHSLNEVTICLYLKCPSYKEEIACKTINMLQELHSSRYLTLNADIVECISSFPDLLSNHPSLFSNLICLTIESSTRRDEDKVKMSTEARNFFLKNSPSVKFIMELAEEC